MSCLTAHAASWQLHTDVVQQKPTTHKVFKQLETALDYGAFLYAAYHIGFLCYSSGKASENSSHITTSLVRCARAVLPDAIIQTGSHVRFVCAALGIIGKTLLYKTMVRLLLLCGDGDLFELLRINKPHFPVENL